MDIERLIECVRGHPFLYDLSHKDYRNVTRKSATWESIGRELNESGDAVYKKWKTIRDGYTKYKKNIKGTTGSGRKNISYTWASQLAFLDNYNIPRGSASNVAVPSPETRETSSLLPNQISDSSQEHLTNQQSMSLSSNPIQLTSPPSPPQVSSPEVPENILTASSSTARTASSRYAGNKRNDDDVGRVINYLSAKKKRELDGVDHLFLSYAESFKKFPPREQALLKIDLAKLFANTELRLLEYDLQSAVASPAYSNVSSVGTMPMNLSDNSTQLVEQRNQYYNSNQLTQMQNQDAIFSLQPINLSDSSYQRVEPQNPDVMNQNGNSNQQIELHNELHNELQNDLLNEDYNQYFEDNC